MLQDYEVRSEFQTNYQYSHDYWAPFVKNAQIYTLAASGYTWTEQELIELSKEQREPIEFNIMRRPLQFFSGYLRDNFKQVIVGPVEGSDQQTADQFTSLQYQIWNSGGTETFINSAEEAMKSGMSLCGLYMNYEKDMLNGDISFYNRTFNAFYLDPTFSKIDLSDCGFGIMRDILSKQVVKQLLPFIDPAEIDTIQNSFRDNKFLSYHPNFSLMSRKRDLMAYDQYYRRTSRPREYLVDMRSSFYRDITDLPKDQKKMLRNGIKRIENLYNDFEEEERSTNQLPPQVSIQTIERPYIELYIMLNDVPVYKGEDKTQIVETFPFVPNICYMEPSIWMPSQRIQGIASTMYSNQRQFNKRHMKIIDMIDSTISTGFKYLIGSVPNAYDLQQSGQNRVIGIDPENAPQGLASVEQLKGAETSPSLMEYQKVLDDLMLTLSNVNESVLGIDDKGNTQISGRLAQVRIGQGLRSNRKVFDNIETAQQLLGSLIIKAIQLNYPPDKIKRMLGEEPTQQFYDKDFEQYDAVLKEGVLSQSQRDAYYSELVNLKREGIIDVPASEILNFLPSVNQSKLKEAIDAQQQQQQQLAQIEMAKQQKELEVLDATKEEKLGLAGERQSRKSSNEGLTVERASEAQQNMAQAALDRARAIMEISKIKEDRILKVLEFVNALEEKEVEGRNQQEAYIQAASATTKENNPSQDAQNNMQQ